MSVRVALVTMRNNPLRTLLSMSGVTTGVGALVAVLSLGDGFERTVREMARADGRMQRVTITARTTDRVAGALVAREDPPQLGDDDATSLMAFLAEHRGDVSAVRLWQQGVGILADTTWARHARISGISVVGTNVWGEQAGGLVSLGRALRSGRDQEPTPVAVISDSLARLMAGAPAAALGVPIAFRLPAPSGATGAAPARAGVLSVTVVGVLATAPSLPARPPLAIVPRPLFPRVATTAAPRSDAALELQVRTVEGVSAARRITEAWLARRFGASWRDSASVQSYAREAEQGARGILLFKSFMGALAGISLLVGGVGIMNVLLASVTERTREIGVRRAAGATRGTILRQFLTESVVVTSVGATLGVGLGIAVAALAAWYIRRTNQGMVLPSVSVSTLAVAALSSIAIGLIFGLYPAWKAARLRPIDALRAE